MKIKEIRGSKNYYYYYQEIKRAFEQVNEYGITIQLRGSLNSSKNLQLNKVSLQALKDIFKEEVKTNETN